MNNKNNNKNGFKIIDAVILIIVLTMIATEILRVIYYKEIVNFEDRCLGMLGLGERAKTARFIILLALIIILFFIRIKNAIRKKI